MAYLTGTKHGHPTDNRRRDVPHPGRHTWQRDVRSYWHKLELQARGGARVPVTRLRLGRKT